MTVRTISLQPGIYEWSPAAAIWAYKHMHIDIWTHNTSNLEAEAWKIDCEQRHENLSSLHLRLDELKTLAHMFLDVRTHTALDFWTPAVIIIILCTALLYFVWKGAVYSLKHKYCHLMCRTRLYLDYSCHVAAIWIWNQKFISWYGMFPIHFTINEGFFFIHAWLGVHHIFYQFMDEWLQCIALEWPI